MLSESERKEMEEGFMQGKCTGFKNFGSNPSIFLALEVSSAVRALNTSVFEMEMSLRVVGGGVCKRAMGTGLGELVVNKERKYWLKREALSYLGWSQWRQLGGLSSYHIGCKYINTVEPRLTDTPE